MTFVRLCIALEQQASSVTPATWNRQQHPAEACRLPGLVATAGCTNTAMANSMVPPILTFLTGWPNDKINGRFCTFTLSYRYRHTRLPKYCSAGTPRTSKSTKGPSTTSSCLRSNKKLLRLSAFPGASPEQAWYRRPGWPLHNIYLVSRQSLYLHDPPSAHKPSSGKPGFEPPTACL